MTEYPPASRRLRKPGRKRLGFAALTVALWATPGMTGMLPVFRDVLQSHLGISTAQFGLLLGIGAIPGALGAVLGGRLVDRLGPRVVMRGCLAGCAAGMTMAGFPGAYVLFLAALGVIAFFGAPLGVAATAYIVRLFPGRRRRALSFSLVATAVAGIIFPLLAEWLLRLQRTSASVRFSDILHVPFLIAACAMTAGMLVYRRPRSMAPPPVADPESPARGAAWTGRTMLLIALLVIHGTVDNSAAAWVPRALVCAGLTERILEPGLVLAMFAVGYVVSRIILVLLPEHWGARRLMIAPGIIGGSLFTAGLLSGSQVWAAVGYVAGGFCWSFEYPVILSMLAGDGEKRFGSALALAAILTGVGTFLMTNVMGYVGASAGELSLWKILFIPALGFPLVGLGGAAYVRLFNKPSVGIGRQKRHMRA